MLFIHYKNAELKIPEIASLKCRKIYSFCSVQLLNLYRNVKKRSMDNFNLKSKSNHNRELDACEKLLHNRQFAMLSIIMYQY